MDCVQEFDEKYFETIKKLSIRKLFLNVVDYEDNDDENN